MGASDSKRTMVVDRTDITVTQDVFSRLSGPEPASESKPATSEKENIQGHNLSSEQIKQLEMAYESRLQSLQERVTITRSKIEKLEEQNEKQLAAEKEEFAKAVDEIEKKFIRSTGSPVCQNIQQDVYQCYRSNPKQTLNCASQVKAFTSCVDDARKDAYDMVQKA